MEKTNVVIQPKHTDDNSYWTTGGEYILICQFGDSEDKENQLI